MFPQLCQVPIVVGVTSPTPVGIAIVVMAFGPGPYGIAAPSLVDWDARSVPGTRAAALSTTAPPATFAAAVPVSFDARKGRVGPAFALGTVGTDEMIKIENWHRWGIYIYIVQCCQVSIY